jgi:ribose 5-phosphate isomerase B
MNIAVGCDHGGLPLKACVLDVLRGLGIATLDLGAHELMPEDDYPDYALAVADAVRSGRTERGIIICGSGVGACVVANKVHGIRAGLCHDTYSAAQGVQHDNVNVLCLGARVIGPSLAEEVVKAFAAARFSGAQRHLRRLAKLDAIEEGETHPRQ